MYIHTIKVLIPIIAVISGFGVSDVFVTATATALDAYQVPWSEIERNSCGRGVYLNADGECVNLFEGFVSLRQMNNSPNTDKIGLTRKVHMECN